MTQPAAVVEDIFCPSCGNWVSYYHFNHDKGFCLECEPIPFCEFCGKEYKPDEFSKKICHPCKDELWLRFNADAITAVMLTNGFDFKRAREDVLHSLRPECISCGNTIKGTRQAIQALFCNKNQKCLKAKRRFRTLREKFGRDTALVQIQLELGMDLIE